VRHARVIQSDRNTFFYSRHRPLIPFSEPDAHPT